MSATVPSLSWDLTIRTLFEKVNRRRRYGLSKSTDPPGGAFRIGNLAGEPSMSGNETKSPPPPARVVTERAALRKATKPQPCTEKVNLRWRNFPVADIPVERRVGTTVADTKAMSRGACECLYEGDDCVLCVFAAAEGIGGSECLQMARECPGRLQR